jgi:sodium-dependent dicarboxylate transporter 2/3/5
MDKKYKIDKRPLWYLFILEYRKAFFLLIMFSVFFTLINYQIFDIDSTYYKTIVIFLFAVIFWITNVIPLSVTSLMIMGIISSYHILENSSIYSFFGNESIFFILGAFIISAGVRLSGLSKRISYLILLKFGNTLSNLVITIFLLCAFLSHIMPEHAVAALIFPILMEIVESNNIKKGSEVGKWIFISMAWGVIIGGVVTYLGGARNPLAIGILKEFSNIEISFLSWYKVVSIPIYILMFFVTLFLYQKTKKISKKLNVQIFNNNLARMKKITFREIKAGFILIITIFLWIFYSDKYGIANISLISAALFFILNVLEWDEASKEINWGVIFMYGGAISLGKALNEVGVLKWLVNEYIIHMKFNPYIYLIFFSFISLFLTEIITNAAVIVVILPIVLEISKLIGIPLEIATIAVAVPSGLAYMFPMSTPAISMIISSDFVKPNDTIKSGFILNIISLTIFLTGLIVYWELFY